MDEEFLNNKETMEMLKITTLPTLRQRIKDGLKVSSGDGRSRRFKKSDVIAYLEGIRPIDYLERENKILTACSIVKGLING